jgi:glutamate/tyrosine decarboxylase-like PLP-dependent enzyme
MDVLTLAAQRAAAYLETIRERRVSPSPEAVARLAELDSSLAEDPTDAVEVIRLLDEVGSPATLGTAGPRFFGWVIGGALPATVGASWLANAWDQCAGLWVASPTGSALEAITQRWLLELLGLPSTTAAAFVTGATMANFTALAAARHTVLQRAAWDVESRGLFGAPEVTVIVGEEVHPSLVKALGLLGFGRDRVTRVPVDGQGRMRADRLPDINGPAIVCVQAGNVNTGAFDALDEIVPAAHEAHAWVHVDGAFGMWAAVSPRLRHLTSGMSEADSWATDAHKWLNVPYDSGLAFVREAEPLRAAMAVTAAYLPPTEERRDPSNFTPELSRRARGVEIWAALKSLGCRGLQDLIERNCQFAHRFAEGLRAAGYQILNEVTLNQVLVSFGSPEKTRRVIRAIQEEGTCWAGGTLWQGKTAMRISVSSWATTEEDVERSLEAMLRAARDDLKGT